MTDRLAHVEARLRELDEAFGALRDRVTRLEGDPRELPGGSSMPFGNGFDRL